MAQTNEAMDRESLASEYSSALLDYVSGAGESALTRAYDLGRKAASDRAREQLRTILDATTAVIYLKDAEGRYVFVNRQFQKVFGLAREEVIGKADDEVLPLAVAELLRRDDLQALEGRAP